jgi:DNA-binding transcriptional regulator YhcF (GntR family)
VTERKVAKRDGAPRRGVLAPASLREMPDSTGRNRSVRPWGNMAAVSHVMNAATVGGTDLLVLMAIAHQSEPEGPEIAGSEVNAWGRKLLPRGSADPSVQTIAAVTRLGTRTVQRSFAKLVEAEELSIVPNAGMAKANMYSVPRLAAAPVPLVADPGVNLQAMHCVMLFSEASGIDLLVQLAIARFVSSHGSRKGSAYPSVKMLAGLTGVATSTISSAIEALEAVGELVVSRRAANYGNNRYTIPMLCQGGVRSTGELPSYILMLSKEEDSPSHTFTQGSSHSTVTPGEVYRLRAQIAVKLVDALIAAERKDPDYRTDAVSDEWRGGAEHLMSQLNHRGCDWLEDPAMFLDALYQHVIESDKWPNVHNPRDVYHALDEILADMAPTPDPALFARERPQHKWRERVDWEATYRDLGISPPWTDSNGCVHAGSRPRTVPNPPPGPTPHARVPSWRAEVAKGA